MGEARRKRQYREGALAAPVPQVANVEWQAGPRQPLAPGKSCGTCTKCCTVMGVPELKKPPRVKCAHVIAGKGCAIYAERPPSCAKFICGWLLDPNMGEELKPDQCHVVFYQMSAENIVASCDADYPDAWRKPNVLEFLHYLARSLGPHRKVVILEQGKTWLVTEDGIVPAERG
jgi:hypothetical protein